MPSVSPLNAPRTVADTTGMKAIAEQPVSLEHQCLEVLGCYAVRETVVKSQDSEFSGWVDRISEAPGIEPSQLSGIHGQLIARGLLKFEFSGRVRGLQYQLSPQGREALGRGTLNSADDCSTILQN
ncbi:MAG: hypothetical protein RL215_1354 [Planctomycetota bacterium]|jgi:hypothetical protein